MKMKTIKRSQKPKPTDLITGHPLILNEKFPLANRNKEVTAKTPTTFFSGVPRARKSGSGSYHIQTPLLVKDDADTEKDASKQQDQSPGFFSEKTTLEQTREHIHKIHY